MATPATPKGVTPQQKAANQKWLAAHPTWTKDRQAIAKAKATKTTTTTTAPTHRDIASTIADVQALKSALFQPAPEQAAANAFAEAQVTPVADLQGASAQQHQNITGVGGEYLKQLADIRTAGANAATGNIELFKQGAQGAADMAAAQAAGGGGVVQNTNIVPSADALGTTAANTNNILAGQQEAGAKQNVLFHAQARSDLAKAVSDRADQVKKLASQEYESAQNRDSTALSNYLTYALYNTQNTDKTTVAKSTLSLNKDIAHQKASAKIIDQGIASRKNEIATLLANGKISKMQADQMGKMYKAVEDVYNHQTGGTSTKPGTTTWKISIVEPTRVATGDKTIDPKTGAVVPGYKIVNKNRIINANDAQYQQFLASGPQGSRKLALLGAQPGSKLVAGSQPVSTTTGGTSSKSAAWSPVQSKQVLIAAGFSAPQVAAIVKTLGQAGTPAGAAAAQTLLTQLPQWLKTGFTSTHLPPAMPPGS